MAPPSSARRFPWSGTTDDTGGSELSLPRRRWQSVGLQVRRTRRKPTEGLFGFRRIMEAEFMGMFLPVFGSMLRRVVSEEVEKAMFRQFSAQPAPRRLLVDRNQHPRYQLMFLNGLRPVYTMTKLEPDDGKALKVAVVERLENGRTDIVRYGPLSSARVEVVALHGNFNAKDEESWSPEEFQKHIVSGREKSAQLLTGNLALKLSGGEAVLENATFTDNSSFTSTKMFRLGLRLVGSSGERVLEGVTKPFRVKERRVEGFEKHYPPMLDDEVWRLKKIGKIGAYHQALSDNGIDSVQEFLRAYMKDEQKLIKIFNKMPQSTWKSIVEHAMTCRVGDSLYLYEAQDKDAVEALKHGAYQNIDGLQPNYKMVNNYPVLSSFPAAQGTSLFSALHPNQQALSYGDSSTGVGFGTRPSRETFNTSLGSSNEPQTSNYMELRHEQTINRVLPYDPSNGTLLPRPRITQLQIPNSERTFFGPPAVIPNNILVGHGVALSEGSHSGFPVHSLSSTDVVMSLMQSPFQLPTNSDHSEQQCNGQTSTQLQQFVTGCQPSRTNSFDLNSCDELIQNFISQISNSGGASTPLSPRKWVKIRAALKLASVGRLSRRGPHCNPPRPRLVPIP
ncbi:Calmodulin-binding protein 60 G [Zea mays]|uniref:Calmodulin-binding protein 60 G n=1 Tax=Zea mays TaxID=4577 RepID=A0A1D6IWA7_MAIZE|nr:Calmodulin-binding protein 60 G [Zea mays]